jgi:hypothetical protein
MLSPFIKPAISGKKKKKADGQEVEQEVEEDGVKWGVGEDNTKGKSHEYEDDGVTLHYGSDGSGDSNVTTTYPRRQAEYFDPDGQKTPPLPSPESAPEHGTADLARDEGISIGSDGDGAVPGEPETKPTKEDLIPLVQYPNDSD